MNERESLLLTIGASKLSDGVDKAFMKLNGPSEAGLGVSGEDEARITLHAHPPLMGIHTRGLLGMEHSLPLSKLKNKCDMGEREKE